MLKPVTFGHHQVELDGVLYVYVDGWYKKHDGTRPPPHIMAELERWRMTVEHYQNKAMESFAEAGNKVIPLNTVTTLDIPPERILEAAKLHDLYQVLIIGADKNGDLFVACSTGDMAIANWMLDHAKVRLLSFCPEGKHVLKPKEPE